MKLENHHFIILLVQRIEKPEPRFNEWKNVSSLGKLQSYGKRNGKRTLERKIMQTVPYSCLLFLHWNERYYALSQIFSFVSSWIHSDHRRGTRLHKKVYGSLDTFATKDESHLKCHSELHLVDRFEVVMSLCVAQSVSWAQ